MNLHENGAAHTYAIILSVSANYYCNFVKLYYKLSSVHVQLQISNRIVWTRPGVVFVVINQTAGTCFIALFGGCELFGYGFHAPQRSPL